MRKFAILTIAAMALTSSAAGASIFSLDVQIYQNDTVNLNSFNITDGETSEQTPGDYLVRTVDSDGETLVSKNFSIHYSVLYNINPNATGNTTSPTGQPSEYRRKLLRLPYSYEAESIQILKSGEEIYSLDIPGRVCVNDDDTCPEYCSGKGVDSDCEDNRSSSTGIFTKILAWLSEIIP